MWKMFDDTIDCNECGGGLGPPPKFMIPPPPRPPSVYEASVNCNEQEMALRAQQVWDNDMCDAIPILDASLYSSQSLQTSAMIAVFSLLLILVVLISSLFVWKNKRKVPNLLPCKTPTRGSHITGALSALTAGHSVNYEDPDSHLGHHRPLVRRHNVEMLHTKSIHYPSGYPMTRSPPFLVSNSPGPDPYRSNDNVYEELGPSRDSDGESEPPVHSDDDFAEDELSLPGERSFNKPANTDVNTNGTSATYQEQEQGNSETNTATTNTIGPERHSVLSSASSTQEASTATVASSSSSHNNNSNTNSSNNSACATTAPRTGAAAILSGMLKHTTARKSSSNGARSKTERRQPPSDVLNTTNSTAEINNVTPIQHTYDNSSNLMALGYQQQHYPHPQSYHHSLHHMNIHNNKKKHLNGHQPTHFYNTIESEVDRRNRINVQLKNSLTPAVATIYREHIQNPAYPQNYYTHNGQNVCLPTAMSTSTNPRFMDKRRGRVTAQMNPIEPAYGYTETVYNQNYHYESCNAPSNNFQQRVQPPMAAYRSCIAPDYYSGSIPSYRQQQQHNHYQYHPASQSYQSSTQIYAPGDSSFGSDSGYSHHTPASSIGRHDYDIVIPKPSAPQVPTQKTPSKLANALSFSWNRRKPSTKTNTNSLNMQANTNKTAAVAPPATTEASSPNNNSGSSTITSTLETNSSLSSGVLQTPNNNELMQA